MTRASFALCVALVSAPAGAQVSLNNTGPAVGLDALHAADLDGIPLSQEWMTGGMAVGDFNNDGWQDLFWVGGGLAADKLFINDGDGTFTDQAAAWGIAAPHCGNAACAGDFNGDGLLDLYVTSYGTPGSPALGSHKLYRNDGGTFTDVAASAGVAQSCMGDGTTNPAGYGAAFGDYDLDGDLDLFVTSYWGNDEGNRLFRNNGDETFTDVTESALGSGIDGVWGFQPAFVDVDGDRYPEILIAADYESSRYLVNNADGTFTDATVPSGTGLDDNGMGQAVGDFDNDGLLDWYVTSIHQVNPPPWNNPGNMLYMAQGDHLFVESSVATGTNDGGWGWGTVAVDLDNDTWLDIVEVNGRPAMGSEWWMEPGKLFHNDGDGTFTEMAAASGFDHADEGRGLVYLDADNDGRMDLAVTTNEGPLAFYRNETSNGNHWLRVTLDTSLNPLLAPGGFGTRVIATVGGTSYVRYVSSAPSYLATCELAVHFGLGSATSVDELRLEWSRGHVTVLADVAADRAITIAGPAPGDIDASGAVGSADLLQVLANWGACDPPPAACVADLDGDGVVGTGDLLILLSNWG